MKKTEVVNRLSVRINILIILLIFLPAGIIAHHYKAKLDKDLKSEILREVAGQLQARADKASFALTSAVSQINGTLKHLSVFLNADTNESMYIAENIPPHGFYESDLYNNLATDLRTELEGNSHYIALRLINAIGQEIVRVEKKGGQTVEVPYQNLQDKSDRFYFKLAMESQSTGAQITTPSLNREMGKLSVPHILMFRVVKKIVLKNGEVMGVLVLNIDARMLFGSIASRRSSRFLVIDDEGTYLHHWDEKLMFGKDLGHGANLFTEEPELEANLKKQHYKIHWDEKPREFRVWRKLFYNSDAKDRYMVFLKILPESQVAAAWASTFKEGTFALFAIAILSLLFIFLAMSIQLRPLGALLASIRKLEKGDLKERANLKSKTEIGTIGSAYDKMAAKLESMTGLTKLQHEVIVSANEASTVNEAMRTSLEKICGYTGWEAGHFFMPGVSGALITSGVWTASDMKRIKPLIEITNRLMFLPGEGLPGHVFQSGKPFWIRNPKDDAQYPRSAIITKIGFRAGFAFPVLEGKKVAAVLEFFTSHDKEPDAFMIEAVKNMGALLGRVTERKRAEEALLESELWMRNIFSSLDEGVLVVAPNREIVNINESAERIFGYSVDELKKSSTEILHVDKRRYVEFGERIRRAFDKGQTARFEFEFKRKNGEVFPADNTVSLLKNTGGEPIGIVSVIRDITKRKRVAEELRESEERLRKLSEAAFEGIVFIENGKIVECNNTFVTMFGYTYDEMIGLAVLDLIAPEYVETVSENIAKDYEGAYEVKAVKKDSSIFSIEAHGMVTSYQGRKARVTAIRDITERKRAEEALRESEKSLRDITSTIGQGVLVIDTNLTITFANPEATRLLGWSEDDLIGENAHTKFHYLNLDGSPQLYEKYVALNSVRAGEDFFDVEDSFIKKDGTIFPISLTSTCIKKEGEVTGAVLAFSDITERKRVQEKLQLASMVVHTATEGVLVTNADAIIESVNPAFTEITGYSAEEAIGQNPSILRSDRHDDNFYKEMWESILKTGRWQGEIWNRRKNGEAYPEMLTISTIKDSEGSPIQYASVFHDITELKESAREIEYKAYHDALTGLPNRQLFYDRLKQTIVRARRAGSMFAVLFLDVDNFKNVNDSLGHAAGDLLLQGVAIRLISGAREEDTVSRLGGDEFTIIIENLPNEQEAANVAERVISALTEPFNHKGEELYSTISIGIALYPANGTTFEELIKNADIAMYSVKHSGKNNYHFFNREMNEKAVRRRELEKNLRKAIDRSELKAYYQPKIDMKTGKIVGMEALVRWIRPEGAVFPDEFIPLAEETRLIVDLDEWMLNAACAFVRKIHDLNIEGIKENCGKVSVNFSAKDIERPNLIDIVSKVIADNEIDPDCLEIEVTESAIINDIDRAINVLASLRKLGLDISIDDFGTGYSSLSYLVKLPINTLKIDRAFVVDLEVDKNARSVAKAIIAMASELGIIVIAEGVETMAQYDFLNSIGCDQVQGYIFSPPVPEDEMLKLLEEGKMLSIT